jgi:hypothetical protein
MINCIKRRHRLIIVLWRFVCTQYLAAFDKNASVMEKAPSLKHNRTKAVWTIQTQNNCDIGYELEAVDVVT